MKLDKKYQKCWNRVDPRCCDMGRLTRSHVPLRWYTTIYN